MHEVTAHPQAADIGGFAPHLGGAYDPILTPARRSPRVRTRGGSRRGCKKCGSTAIWVHFHGFGAEHDRQFLRRARSRRHCLAVRRAREAGLEIGANVSLTNPALAEIDRLPAVSSSSRSGSRSGRRRRSARASTCRTRTTRRCGRSSATSCRSSTG